MDKAIEIMKRQGRLHEYRFKIDGQVKYVLDHKLCTTPEIIGAAGFQV